MTRSVLEAEVYAFSDALHMAIAFRTVLKPIFKKNVPIFAFTDLKSLFDTITKASQISEKRLLIDVKSTREAFMTREIQNVGWITSKNNIADSLTKHSPNQTLAQLLHSGILIHPTEQRIILHEPYEARENENW